MGFCLSKSLLDIVEKQINQASRDVLDVCDSESSLSHSINQHAEPCRAGRQKGRAGRPCSPPPRTALGFRAALGASSAFCMTCCVHICSTPAPSAWVEMVAASSSTCFVVLVVVVLPQLPFWGVGVSSAFWHPRRGTRQMPQEDKRRELSLAFSFRPRGGIQGFRAIFFQCP